MQRRVVPMTLERALAVATLARSALVGLAGVGNTERGVLKAATTAARERRLWGISVKKEE